jgi:hypothetical protein
VDNFCCLKPATAGNAALARVPGRSFWLQWTSNKQLPNVLLEGASSFWTRLFFGCGTALRAFTSLRDMSLHRSGFAALIAA